MNRARWNLDVQWVWGVAHVSQPVAARGVLADAKLSRNFASVSLLVSTATSCTCTFGELFRICRRSGP
jgi:hypothetical protein